MRKWIIVALVIAAFVAVWWYMRTNFRYTPLWNQPKFGEIVLGDIRVPITAAGLIEPKQRVVVKSEASGEVIDVPVVEGSYVKAGQVLVLLKKDDEERNVLRAQADVDRAEAALAQAKVGILRARESINAAQGRVEELEAQVARAEYDYKKVRANYEDQMANEQEMVISQSTYKAVQAQLRQARSSAETAKLSVDEADAAIRLQEAAVRVAKKTLEDSLERLSETTISASVDAVVTDVQVKPGMLVQSGTQSLTGGTIIMSVSDVTTMKVLTRVDEADYGRVLAIAPIEALPHMPGLQEAAAAELQTAKSASGENPRHGHVTLTVDAFPDRVFEGRIERVEPQGKLNQGSSVIQFDVHVEITDKDRHLLPLGTQAQVEFTVESASKVLLVPAEAVKTFQNERGVWLEVPAPRGSNESYGKKFVPARFGITDGTNTQVVSTMTGETLKPGQRVYTKLPVEPENDD